MSHHLALHFLGTPQLYLDNSLINTERRKAIGLLAYLANERGQHSRESLSAFLWPDYEQSKAFTNLRHTLWEIQKAIGEGWLNADRNKIGLNEQADIWLDVAQFKSLSEQSRSQKDDLLRISLLVDSAKLYRNQFLAGFNLKDAYSFNEWILAKSEELRRDLADILNTISEDYCVLNQPEKAIPYARRLITLDPLNESSHRRLMNIYNHAGQHSAALMQYKTCEQVLREELQLDPQPETLALYKIIRKGELKPAQVARQKETALPKHNLPSQLSSFFGREKEQVEIMDLVSKNRLVTLVGTGGIGKTRLSLQIAEKVVSAFKDGVWFIELAPLSDPALILNTIASVLGVREEQGRPLMATMLDWLRDKDMLFVLDNCEHLVKACAEFAAAGLLATRGIRILASSREALGTAGERVYHVPSLEIPNPKDSISIETVTKFAAMRLFIERATQALKSFSLTNANAPGVVQICYRLDGIPLAIELAAARVKVLRVDQIAQRLDNRFRLLTSGSQAVLPRHQTLRAMIDWSYDLLSETEQVLFRRLSAFVGGWTLEAAESVCAGERIESLDVLDLLDHLIDKSLIGMDEQAVEPRYQMLETIRQYAREKLVDSNEDEKMHDQHLSFFVQFAEYTEPMFYTPQLTEWLPRLESEHRNLQAALEWACERNIEASLWLAGLLERFWFFGDHVSEAYTWYSRVLNDGARAPITKGLALALYSSGCVSLNLEHLDEAQVSLELSITFWQQLGEQQRLASSLAWLAYLFLQRGESEHACAIYSENESLFRTSSGTGPSLAWILSCWGAASAAVCQNDPAAKALLDEALSLAHSLQDPLLILLAFSSLGDWAVLQGDYENALRYFQESLVWRRQLGTQWIIAAGLRQVANEMCLRGDYQQAEPLYSEALAMARSSGDQHSEAFISQALGEVEIHRGNFKQATMLLTESLSSFRKWEDALGIARCLIRFADLWQMQGQVEQAAHILGFVEPWLESNQLQLVIFDETHYMRSLAATRAQLDETAFNAVWKTGNKMTVEEAMQYAMNN
jgi:predicted ATPase/DNA-binding SARP family transcriptional activator